MKTYRLKTLLLVALLGSCAFAVRAQSYAIDWYKVSGGGGTSTGGVYAVSGTIGQHDASGPMSGGGYTVQPGYWAMINVVQTAGLPNLVIVGNGSSSVKVLWPAPATNTYTLQQTSGLGAGNNWVTSGYSIINANGTNSITITPPVGNLFFRLKQ